MNIQDMQTYNTIVDGIMRAYSKLSSTPLDELKEYMDVVAVDMKNKQVHFMTVQSTDYDFFQVPFSELGVEE